MMLVQKTTPGQGEADRPVGELLAERPVLARLFERLHIDYCCGGQQTLAQACGKAGAELGTVLAAVQAISELDAGSGERELTDWRTVETAQLCEHIVTAHHDFLRQNFPRIDSLIGTVVRVHGAGNQALGDLPSAFEELRSALEPHLASEETELFPTILAAVHGGPAVPETVLAGHEYEHEQVGAALAEIRGLCDDYDRRRARCNTHRAMLDALEELELDIHQHVHEENNVLFPRARAARPSASDESHGAPPGDTAEQASAAGGAQTLPACCRGWVAEQGQRWARTRHGR